LLRSHHETRAPQPLPDIPTIETHVIVLAKTLRAHLRINYRWIFIRRLRLATEWYLHERLAARLEHAMQFAHGRQIVRHMLQHVTANDCIERATFEWQLRNISSHIDIGCA
jgi:hypothetical protein